MKIEGITPPEKCKLETMHAGLKHSDLIPKVYEGGYKVWECSLDLIDFLLTQSGNMDFVGKNVLELGCGQGLPGIYALLHGASVVLQDFNAEVLEEVTLPCIHHNISLNGLDHPQKEKIMSQMKLIPGDWEHLATQMSQTFDYIFTSETIYNTDYYAALHEIMQKAMKKDGTAILASKRYYYGVGGGIDTFLDFVDEKGIFTYEVVKTIDEGISNVRNIITLKFK